MITGTTSSGFAFELEDDVLDDYELLEVLHKVDNGEESYVVEMVDMLLGYEQKNRLKEHIKNTNRRVSASKMMDEVAEIFNATQKGKN